MPYYPGDTIKIEAAANDFDGELMTGDDALVTLSILAADSDNVEADAVEMTWSASDAAYVYDWDTTDVVPGAYRAHVTLVHEEGTSVEKRVIVLSEVDAA